MWRRLVWLLAAVAAGTFRQHVLLPRDHSLLRQRLPPKVVHGAAVKDQATVPPLGPVRNPQSLMRSEYNKPFKSKVLNTSQSLELNTLIEAWQHDRYVRETFSCHTPRPFSVRVKSLYPRVNVEYLPRSAVLHRCGDHSGCCQHAHMVCGPREIQEVSLLFIKFLYNDPFKRQHVERLFFPNHTLCECRNIRDPSDPLLVVPHDSTSPPTITIATASEPPTSTPGTTTSSTTTTDITTSTITTTTQEPPATVAPLQFETLESMNECLCPSPFYKRVHPDSMCSCDCFDKQRSCLRIKRGKDPLDERNRKCVDQGYCHLPECDFGEFNTKLGACPPRPAELGTKRGGCRSPPTQHPFHERD